MATTRRPSDPRRWRMRLGVRGRVTLLFGLLALALSLLLAVLSWSLVTHFLVAQRESSAAAETAVDAGLLQREIDARPVDVSGALDTVGSGASAAVLRYDDAWYATSLDPTPSDLPAALVERVEAGTASTQRIEIDGRPLLAVGMPLQPSGNAYFAVYDLTELNRTFRVLSASLAGAALLTVVCGLVLGRSASRRALRPLTELNDVASAVASGRLTARMDTGGDPDLAPLARSFNATVESLQRRVRADARFAGDVSHELRTPLTTMLNSVQVLQNRRARLPEEVREPLDLLAEDLERFRRMVVDLLEISRAEDESSATSEAVAIGELVERAADEAAKRPVTMVEPEAADVIM
ncbi:histidine kinase dimerization/phospho-acceptor domain-containing protein, partial [Mumia sp.]